MSSLAAMNQVRQLSFLLKDSLLLVDSKQTFQGIYALLKESRSCLRFRESSPS